MIEEKNCTLCNKFLDCQSVMEIRSIAIKTNSEIADEYWKNAAEKCDFYKNKYEFDVLGEKTI